MLHVPSMEGLGVVGDGVPQRFPGETTVASKGLVAFVFMALSVHEYQRSRARRGKAPDLTSKHNLALIARLRDGQPAPAFQVGDAALLRDERAPALGSRPCGTDVRGGLPPGQRASQPDLLFILSTQTT